MADHTIDISNVLIIGCGGSGLRAAIEAKMSGLNVKILGKRNKYDAHTVLAAGGINAAFGNLDKNDNWEEHFIDTYLEGYCIGDPKQIEFMTKESLTAVEEIDNWGANFQRLENGKLDQRFFGAHTYRRTCYSGDFTGQSILNALLNKAKSLRIPIYDSQYVTKILVDNMQCFGVMSINTKNGERTIHLADAVIISTGGHTRIWKRSSSRKKENLGDGYFLASQIGCKLIDMEMVQFHPTGMIYPEEIAGQLVTEAVRGEGGRLYNANGERFMINYDKERMELSTRDKIAIANYTEIVEGRGTKNGAVLLDISHKDKDFIVRKIPKIYRQFIETQMLDISKTQMEVAPTAHYSMGGIFVDPIDHSTEIAGLYAVGEVAGGLHGANRLGGNSLAEIIVFGKHSGAAAARYSRNLKCTIRSKKSISIAHEYIDSLITKGEHNVIQLQNELTKVMWDYCGVIKDEKKLNIGLSKLNDLKLKSKNIDVIIDENNVEDLINKLDLTSSIFSAECTILSSLQRRESRGAHQRSHYKEMSNSENCNYAISLKNNSLYIEKLIPKELSEKMKNKIQNSTQVNDFKNRLLE